MRSAIAIVAPYVVAVGVKTVLQPFFEQTDLLVYDSVSKLRKLLVSTERTRPYFVHFFVTTDFLRKNAIFFLRQPQMTIELIDNKTLPDTRFNTLDISQNEEGLYKQLLTFHRDHRRESYSAEKLTVREVDILRCVAKGMINKQMADYLSISINTVITHRQHITEKLGMKSVAALTVYAVVHGYVDYNEIV